MKLLSIFKKKKKFFFLGGGGSGVRVVCEWRSEAFVKIQKKKLFFFFWGGGGGGSGWMGMEN